MNLIFNQSTLPNGVRIVSSTMPHIDSASVGIWVGVGGRYEALKATGFSHFIEHLLFKGTKNRSAREISEAIEGRGGYLNAFTQEESTCYYARVTSEHLSEVVEVLSDMVLRPKFDAVELNRERGVIIEEIMMYRDQPSQHVQDMLGELLWVKHPMGRPLIGTPKNIARAPRAEIRAFKQAKYLPTNTVISLAGQLDHDACVKQVAKLFRGQASQAVPRHSAVTAKTRQELLGVDTRTIEQTHLSMGVRLFGRHDSRRFALKLLSVILGENMSSRLFQSVREDHGLAYSIHSSVHLYADTGTFEISAGLERARIGKALDLIFTELARVKARKVRAAELQRAKDYALGQLRIGLESSSTQMMWLGDNLTSYGSFTQPADVVRKLNRVTAEQIQRVAQQVLKPERVSVALVSPDEEAALRPRVERAVGKLV